MQIENKKNTFGNRTFKVLSFDLDDTLYDNNPVISNAEKVSSAYLKTQFDLQQRTYRPDVCSTIKNGLLNSGHSRYENMSFLRQDTLKQFCQELNDAKVIAERAFELFIETRNQILIPGEIIKLLEFLTKEYIIVSATNGNCVANNLSVAANFSQHYSVENGNRAKPHPNMLLNIIADFNLQPGQLLHIGDSLSSDGQAAISAGVDFYHFSPFAPGKELAFECDTLMSLL